MLACALISAVCLRMARLALRRLKSGALLRNAHDHNQPIMGGKKASVEEGLQHPQGVQPWGNYLFLPGRDTRNEGAVKEHSLNPSMAEHDWLAVYGCSLDIDAPTPSAVGFCMD